MSLIWFSLGGIISLIFLIRNIIKNKPKTTPVIFLCVFLVLLIIEGASTFTGFTTFNKTDARYIKHSEIVNNFDIYNGEFVRIEGIVWLTDKYKDGDDIRILNVVDGEYSINMVQNTVNYKPYNGEYLTVYGEVSAVSKEPVFFDVKAVRIKPKFIEQMSEPSEELKNDVLIQEFIKQK